MEIQFNELTGKRLVSTTGKVGDDEIRFTIDDGAVYVLYHDQDCCEGVAVEGICGDMADLQDCEVISAEESTSDQLQDGKPEHPDSFTWTFYKIQTNKGAVTIRWLGESNGYYSESVYFRREAAGG